MLEKKSSTTSLTTIVTSIAALLSVFVLLFSFLDFPESQGSIPGPRVFPMLVSAIMLISATYILVKSRFKNNKGMRGSDTVGGASAAPLSFFTLLASIILYSILVASVGFFVSTVVFLFLMMKKYTPYPWYGVLGLSALISLLVYFVFNTLLNVPLDILWGIGE